MYLTAQNPHGGDIYGDKPLLDFSASINPFGMPAAVRRALKACVEKCALYPDPYCRRLRAAVSAYEGVPAEYILAGGGASELIYQYAAALPGGPPALIVSPSFSEYAAALEASGRRAEHYVLKPENGFNLTEDILSLDLSGYSAVFLCSPANPTGVCVEPELLRAIAATGARLFCDFCFLDLTDGPERYAITELLEDFPNVSVLRSPTKSFAVPGVRLGYLMSRDRALLERMSALGQCWNVSVPAQAAGEAAMSCGGWLRERVKLLSAERERLSGKLTKTGLRVFPGEANFLLAYSERELVRPLRELGFALRDCRNFVGLGEGYFRLAVRTAEENDMLLNALGEVLL